MLSKDQLTSYIELHMTIYFQLEEKLDPPQMKEDESEDDLKTKEIVGLSFDSFYDKKFWPFSCLF